MQLQLAKEGEADRLERGTQPRRRAGGRVELRDREAQQERGQLERRLALVGHPGLCFDARSQGYSRVGRGQHQAKRLDGAVHIVRHFGADLLGDVHAGLLQQRDRLPVVGRLGRRHGHLALLLAGGRHQLRHLVVLALKSCL